MSSVDTGTNTFISESDRGFNYGDGIFTTLLVQSAKPIHYPLHESRLKYGCQRLCIPEPSWLTIGKEVTSLCTDEPKAVIKIIITRGEGGRGYSPTGANQANVVITKHAYPEKYETWQNGIEIGIADTKLGLNPLTAGIKHLNRLEQVLIRKELDEKQLLEGVVADINGHVISVSAGNLFWQIGTEWFTPSLQNSGIEGIMRHLLIQYCQENDISCRQVLVDIEKLLKADSVLICNSIMGLVPIKRIDRHQFDSTDSIDQLRMAVC